MKSSVREELAALLQETEALLNRSQPATSDLEEYGRRRLELFARLQGLDSRERQERREGADLEALFCAVLKGDQRLISKLNSHMNRCREELSDLASEKQALKGYAWASPHTPRFLRCRV